MVDLTSETRKRILDWRPSLQRWLLLREFSMCSVCFHSVDGADVNTHGSRRGLDSVSLNTVPYCRCACLWVSARTKFSRVTFNARQLTRFGARYGG